MKSRRKIWSLPLVLVTALLLVGLLGAAVLAQVNAAPVKATQIEDQTITINSSSTTTDDVDIDLEDVDGQGGDAFTDADGGTLAYTAMTSDLEIAFLTGLNEASTVAEGWWNALGNRAGAPDANPAVEELNNASCTAKAAILGFSLTANTATDDTPDRPDNAPAVGAGTGDDAARGLCRDHSDFQTADVLHAATTGENALAAVTAEDAVIAAFHWDMLSGDEMVVAATAAGENSPSGYEKRFAGLSHAQKLRVLAWFGDENILSRGEGGDLILDHYGIDGVDEDGNPEGKAGSATITVKVSDDEGRLIPPGDGSKTVGQSFTVTANRTETGEIEALDTDDGTDGFDAFSAPGDTANGLTFTIAVPADDIDARVNVRVSPGTTKILDVTVTTENALEPHHQLLNFSVGNGGTFQSLKTGLNTAQIRVAPGATLTDAAPYDFKLTVNEIGNAPRNSGTIDIQLTVVLDNAAPTFGTGAPTAGSVPERAKEYEIATFTASDPNNQVLTFDLVNDDAPDALFESLDIDSSTGVLTTTDEDDSVEDDPTTPDIDETAADQPDFIEAVADDPATLDVDESKPAGDNEHDIYITVTDGTTTVRHPFTLTVTEVDDPARGASLNFDVDENQAAGAANAIDEFQLKGATGNYRITEEIDGSGIRRAGSASLFVAQSKEDDDEIGIIFVRRENTLDFEDSDISNNYTLSVTADNATPNLITIRVQDVNEGPKFSSGAKRMEKDAAPDGKDKGYIELFVLESASVGTVTSIGQDAGGNPTSIPARFTATDEDSAATGNAIAYDLWHDNDLTDDETDKDDAFAGTDVTFRVSANGAIEVNTLLDTDADDAVRSVDLVLRAVDAGEQADTDPVSELKDTLMIRVTIIDTNVAPEFDAPSRLLTHATVSEGAAVGTVVHTYRATDEDGDTVRYRLRDEDDAPFFSVEETMNAAGEEIGVVKTAAGLDYEVSTAHTVEIQAYDTDGDTDEIVIEIEITNENDETPTFLHNPLSAVSVVENTPRGMQSGEQLRGERP